MSFKFEGAKAKKNVKIVFGHKSMHRIYKLILELGHGCISSAVLKQKNYLYPYISYNNHFS